MAEVFASESELDRLMDRVRSGQVPNEEFSHRYHLAMAACIVFEGGTFSEVRQTILDLNAANKVEQTLTGGYHETLTVTWHALVSAHVQSLPKEAPRLLVVNSVLHALADKRAVLEHYSKDRIMSWEARKGFVEPDLKPLPSVKGPSSG